MSSLLIILALVGLLGVLVMRVTEARQPATSEQQIHREQSPSTDADDIDDTVRTAPKAATAPARAETRDRPRRIPFRIDTSDVRTPPWRRILSTVELIVLASVIGAILAASLAAVAVAVGAMLDSAI